MPNREQRRNITSLYINKERAAAFKQLEGQVIETETTEPDGTTTVTPHVVDDIRVLFYLGFDRLIQDLSAAKE